MYNCRQPRASHWGLALAGTRRGWGQFGTRGVRVQPPERAGVTVRGLTSAPGWKADGAASSPGAREGGGSQGCRRRCPEQGCVLPAHSQREERQHGGPAVSPSPCAHEGRDGHWMKSMGRRGDSVGCSLCHSGLVEKCLFSPPKAAALIEEEGCLAWCCLKGSLRCRARH